MSEPELSQRAIGLLQRIDAIFESGEFDPTKITRIWNPLTGEVVDKMTLNMTSLSDL